MKIDSKDKRILDVLQRHADYPTRRIANETRLPITTVHNRVKKLKDQGIIRHYTVALDYEKLGLPIAAYILVNASLKDLKEKKLSQFWLAKKMRTLDFVEQAAIVTGTSDIVLKVRMSSIKDLNTVLLQRIQALDGVQGTQTLVIIAEFEASSVPQPF
jgi:Lrp/AsnC family transcriptional regulator, regulator for asnA, asnC and gidA